MAESALPWFYPCSRCGALVAAPMASTHSDWHAVIEGVVASVEYADQLRREEQERPSG